MFALISIFTTQRSLAAEFVGSFECQQCHQQAFKDWTGSDHDMAMKHANKDSVVANFNTQFSYQGKQNRFFTKGDEYWVNIEDLNGQFNDFKVSYTFGIEPLQQYMVEFADGRVQLIPFAWDNRPKAEGGQKWFHLYPDNSAKHDDFFWQNVGQNWNFMCADCHSTNVKKNYDFENDRFNTTFSEINVGCEACHGAASEHLTWANKPGDKTTQAFGFDRALTKPVASWTWSQSNNNAAGSSDSTHSVNNTAKPASAQHSNQLQSCAQCHSRRLQISDSKPLVNSDFGDRYQLNLIGQDLYYDDGQVFDEDYVYGSFLQSKMHENGVVCSNCHNPHSTKIVLPGNALCSQCHSPAKFDTVEHHKHQVDSSGAQCVNCHMPQTTYMQIDKRRDHSFSIPKPANSQRIGTPNACNQCHQDKDIAWAVDKTARWYPGLNTYDAKHFSSAFAGARAGIPAAGDQLSYIAQDHQQAAIIRAAAIERLQQYPGRNGVVAIARATRHDDPLLRFATIQGSTPYPIADRWRMLAPLLTDEVLMVRSQAAGALAGFWSELTPKQQQTLTKPLAEYIEILKFNGDRGFARTNLAHLYANQGKVEQAVVQYKAAIAVQANYAAAYINLADLYRANRQENLAMKTLEQGIKAQPTSGAIQFSMALALLRAKETENAMGYLLNATELEPNNGRFWYVYAIAVTPTSVAKAAAAFDKAYQVSGNPQYLYALCELMLSNNTPQAKQCLQDLSTRVPADAVKQLKARFQQ
ncbi:deca-heme c-type cytochrome [Shewanella sp. KX20019]|uniref:multiheme c-type cytochrome n=1 Tax=Shewanella sp. KX20019 TaxID=2803864 RepID=UPI001926ED1B|nr:multiheme c-type cytochrome [Shewanella sp. KX20019]QQX78359.1 deca-heme c-type cytochrome [Shewanella sp. KX20019]